ncbi:hypothetical protein Xbed_03603 [Xenorhabdus beddingii]|uniref:Uncharacterized protein n=1 Tax=Xenorhabdus beddingii TaxID=40578 RepID=A0A1Y2SBJ5_9GAMM|nr:hypothetical protein Xbed_03603 [Xenorhabdus beddingii]
MGIGKAVNPIRTGHMAIPRTPERHRINQGFTQDHRGRTNQPRFIPDAAMRPRQIEMQRGARPQAIGDFAAVHFLYLPLQPDHRHDQRAAEVFMAALTQQPDGLQLRADLCAGFQFFLRQPIAEGAVGKTELKVADQFRMVKAAFFQVLPGFRGIQQGLVIELSHP